MQSSGYADDELVQTLCEEVIFEDYAYLSLTAKQCYEFIRSVFCTLRCELEVLQDIVDDDSIQEIMVNGCDDVFVERNGKIEKVDIKLENKEQLRRIIQRLVAKVGREINELNPIVDARLSDGSRINAVYDNIAINGPILTIRKFKKDSLKLCDLIDNGDISEEAAVFLQDAVRCGYSIFISGGTSSGKTTFLNILSDFIPKDERIIVIEDSAELQIRGHDNYVRMESKSGNIQGKGSVSIKTLLKSSLRMRPDRIIVGEVRGDEIVDMIAAMSTGHDGSLSTGHANSPKGMLLRLESLYLSSLSIPLESVRTQIADAIELIVQLKRFPDGHRRVIEITEVCGVEKSEIVLNRLFERIGGQLQKVDELTHNEKMLA